MLEALMTELGTIITSAVTLLKNAFSAVIGVIYTPGTSGAAGTFTDIGVLILIPVAIAVVMFALSWVLRLVKGVRFKGGRA